MTETIVVNIRTYKVDGRSLLETPFDQWPSDCVYIGRPGQGLTGEWGNPIVIGQICPVCSSIHHDRTGVIRCYGVLMRCRLLKEPSMRERILALSGKKLVCFCAPKPCHGNALVKIINEIR